jgi:hypothetical protein
MKRRTPLAIPLFILLFLSVSFAGESRDIIIPDPDKQHKYTNQAHQGLDCAKCHSILAYADESDLPLPDPSAGCRSCHATGEAAAPPKSIWHTKKNKDCVRCHSFHESNKIFAAGDEFELSSENQTQKMACLTCHSSSASIESVAEYHIEARHLFHSDITVNASSLSAICLNCHGGEMTPGATDFTTDAISVTHSASHPIGIKPVLGQGDRTNKIRDSLDPDVTLYDGRIECQTCHQLNRSQTAFASPFEPAYDLCLGCHEHNG